MICKGCKHFVWFEQSEKGGNWLLFGCAPKRVCFGKESDLKKPYDKKRIEIAPVPTECKAREV